MRLTMPHLSWWCATLSSAFVFRTLAKTYLHNFLRLTNVAKKRNTSKPTLPLSTIYFEILVTSLTHEIDMLLLSSIHLGEIMLVRTADTFNVNKLWCRVHSRLSQAQGHGFFSALVEDKQLIYGPPCEKDFWGNVGVVDLTSKGNLSDLSSETVEWTRQAFRAKHTPLDPHRGTIPFQVSHGELLSNSRPF